VVELSVVVVVEFPVVAVGEDTMVAGVAGVAGVPGETM
jgi:hypothetical protein